MVANGRGQGGVTTTAGPPAAPRVVLPARPAPPALRSGFLGWISAVTIAISVLLMIAVSAAGPSAVIPVIPRTWPDPPLWLPLHLSQLTVTTASYTAIALGAAGGALTLVPGYLIAGPHALTDLVWRSGNLVTFDSFWRLFYPPFGYSGMPAGLELIAAAACVAMAALLAWRLPPGPAHLPAVRPALVLMLAWLLVWPLQRPWYDAIAFCLLAVFPASRLDWLALIRAVPAAMAVATGAAPRHPHELTRVIAFVGNDLTPDVRLAAVIAAVLLCALGAWELRRPRRGSLTVEAAAPS